MDGERETRRADLVLERGRASGVAHGRSITGLAEARYELPGVAKTPVGTVAGLGVT